MPYIIHLPEPCHEDWNLMTPNERGRHCNQCSKTVMDFTGWQQPEIIFYLQTNSGACGRFRKNQLDVPLPSPEDFVEKLVRMPVSFIKRVAAIFLFVFGLMAGTSCNVGEPKPAPSFVNAISDTVNDNHLTSGMIIDPVPLPDTTVKEISTQDIPKPAKQIKPIEAIEVPDYPMGGVPVFEEVKIDTLRNILPRDTLR